MKKAKSILLAVLAIAAGTAQAGAYSVLQESDCALVTPAQLSEAVRKAGTVTGLNLPKDMALRTELHCAVDGKVAGGARYVYTFRATMEKQVSDGEQLRWIPIAHQTGFGTVGAGTPLLRQVHFTVRDLVRQEP